MKPLLLFLSILAVNTTAMAQRVVLPVHDEQIMPLWSDPAPGSQGTDDKDIPTLTVYLPRSLPEGMTAMVICPGGGYGTLTWNTEGRQIANYLNSMGMMAFVLKYRLGPKYNHPVELGDAQRAMRIVRSHAAEWHINPERIGIAGFSAGGHLATTVATHFDTGQAAASDPIDRVGSRPDFVVLGYPVISLVAPWTHAGSRNNLLGPNPDPELAKSLSGELSVTKETPPTFIFQTNEDVTVPAENAVYYYLALRKAGIPAEMHVFEKGAHGAGLGMDSPTLAQWPILLTNWLRLRGVLK